MTRRLKRAFLRLVGAEPPDMAFALAEIRRFVAAVQRRAAPAASGREAGR